MLDGAGEREKSYGPLYNADVSDDLIQLGRDLRLAPGKAPRTAAWFGEWQEAVADLERRSGAR